MAVKKENTKEFRFPKSVLVESEKIGYSKDAINAILKDYEEYTMEEAVKLLKTFMEGDV